jgi:thiazole synthase
MSSAGTPSHEGQDRGAPAARVADVDVAAQAESDDLLSLGNHRFHSRLFVGTGKYADFDTMRRALEVSGTEVVTVAVRRVDFSGPPEKNLLHYIDRERYTILPNTAGCYSAEEAIRVARLGRELGISELVKLEVLGDPRTLLPDPIGTLEATRALVAEGFTVLVYTSDDPILARRLEEAGATSVMPAGSPIGSGQGILNPNNLRIILETLEVPVIVDAGVGTASDVSVAMELGAAGVLLNTGIAGARDPVRMARAMRLAAVAGRDAFLAGRIPRKLYANASSPTEGTVGSSE